MRRRGMVRDAIQTTESRLVPGAPAMRLTKAKTTGAKLVTGETP